MLEKQIGAVVRHSTPKRTLVRGVIVEFVTRDGDLSHARVIWPKVAGVDGPIEGTYKLEELEVESTSVQALIMGAHNQHDEWKRELGAKASALAAEHEMCGIVDEFLRENEIPVPSKTIVATVTMTIEVTADFTGNLSDLPRMKELDYFRESLSIHDGGEKLSIRMDSDWDGEEFNVTGYMVDEIVIKEDGQ